MSLKVAVLFGSVRSARQGIKAARFVCRQLETRGHDVELIDAQAVRLPFLDRMFKEYAAGEAPENMQSVAATLERADAFVIVSAEYNHGEPPALKNLLDHYQSEYHYKPSAIVTYSAGPFGGVRSLITLRAILAELGTPSIPSAFPISKVQDAFDERGNALDKNYERRIGRFLDEFEWYGNALRNARQPEQRESAAPEQQQMCRGD